MDNLERFIYGKSGLQRIVSCEVAEGTAEVFFEDEQGNITSKVKKSPYWIMSPVALNSSSKRLHGNLFYKFITEYNTFEEWNDAKQLNWKKDLYVMYDPTEATLVKNGASYYKGMKVEDVSVLAFDIESTGLVHDSSSKVLLISNVYRSKGKLVRKLFAYDDYATEKDFFDAWCDWVREVNPSVVIGHNIQSYDLPYLNFCALKAGTTLNLGRNGSELKIESRVSKKRIDGSREQEFNRSRIYGREICDTYFLALNYDFSRKYESYGLKQIIKQEGLEKEGRQFYDAATIRDNYKNPEEWAKIKRYAEFDADDALSLYDLMIPAYFYLNQSIPKSFQSINESATGSQLNSFLVRSYLQEDHSIPKTTKAAEFEGAISIGNPGIYKDVFKVDVASLYPSIMLQFEVYDRFKDPYGHFYVMVEHFTKERLENKKKAKETGDKYYKDLEQAQKIVINSAYGLMGAPGLCFNSPANAALVTREGRNILQKSIDWALAKGFQLVNADTDSISITINQYLDEATRKGLLSDLNSLFPNRITFEDDGYYESVVVIKTKNYALFDGKKVKIKGSGLKATNKEKALVEFINTSLHIMLGIKNADLKQTYLQYVREICELKDIGRWTTKKTITEKVLDPKRTNEQKVLDAIQGEEISEGDKIRVYFTTEQKLKLEQHWCNDHDRDTLLEKLFKTAKTFETVLDMANFPNFSLKRNRQLLEQMVS